MYQLRFVWKTPAHSPAIKQGPVWVHRQQWLLSPAGKESVVWCSHFFFSREKRKAGERGELLACCVQLSSCFQLYEWCLACVFSRVNVKGRLLVFFYTQTLSRGGRPVIVQNDHAGTALPPSECALELAVQGRLLNLSATCSNQISTARSSGKPSPPRQSYS